MQPPATRLPFMARPSPRVGVTAGLLGGAIYLVAQFGGSLLLQHEDGWALLRRIAALILGPIAATSGEASLASVVGLALAIHVALSAAYGRVVDVLVMNLPQRLVAALAGAVFGALLYVVNYCIVAPILLPWYEPSPDVITALDHVLFGLVTALACRALRQRMSEH